MSLYFGLALAASESAPPVTILRVQTATNGSAVGNVTATFAAPPTAGNLLVGVYPTVTATIAAPPAGWSVAQLVENDRGVTCLAAYRIVESGDPSAWTFTSPVSDSASLALLEYSGIDADDPLDRAVAQPGYSIGGDSFVTTMTTNQTGMTRRGEALAVAFMGLRGASGGWGTWTDGFTSRATVTGGTGGSSGWSALNVADLVLVATQHVESSVSWTTARTPAGGLVTFRGATADTPVVSPTSAIRLRRRAGGTFTAVDHGVKTRVGGSFVAGLPKLWTGTEWATPYGTTAPAYALWSDANPTGDVVITTNTVLDVTLAEVDSLTINEGVTLRLDPDQSVKVESIGNIEVNGTLEMQPASAAVVHELHFPAVDEEIFVGGGHEVLATDVGLWVTHDGTIIAQGTAKTPWTRLTGAASATATSIEVEDAAGWRVGDEIVVVPHEPPTVSNHWLHYDERTIASITGSGPYTIGLAALTHPHNAVTIGGTLFTAEVLNLTRNVKISGTSGGRTHFMIMGHSPTVAYVEAVHTGPRNLPDDDDFIQNARGRYSFHWHQVEGHSVGLTVEGCVSHKSGGHAFVPHSSNGITFDRCIVHDSFDEAYWYDTTDPDVGLPGGPANQAPVDVTYDRCVASNIKVNPSHRGFRLAGFLLAHGMNNAIRGCVTVGIQGNQDASGYLWAEGAASVFDFRADVRAHNNKRHGIFVWQNTPLGHFVEETTCWWNAHAGIAHGAYANAYHYRDTTVCHGNGETGLIISAQNLSASSPYGALRFTGCVFDADGVGEYAVINGHHSLVGAGNVEVSDCQLLGYTVAAIGIGIESSGGVADQVAFVDCTFEADEDGWLTVTEDCHPDSVITITNGNGNGLTYTCRRSDHATGTFHAPWNCKRVTT